MFSADMHLVDKISVQNTISIFSCQMFLCLSTAYRSFCLQKVSAEEPPAFHFLTKMS